MSDDTNPGVNPHKLYRDMVAYVEEHGYRRFAKNREWWLNADASHSVTLAAATELALHEDGIDLREVPS